jgi:RNA polymerase sigma-70 factor, ECF subfamily
MTREDASGLIDELFGTWGPVLLRFALRRIGSRPTAEDLVQDAFLVLYRELRRGKTIENPKAWTLSVVRRQLARQFRDLMRHGEQHASDQAMEKLAGAAEIEAPVDSWIGRLAGLSSGLSGREEEVLLLRLESMKYREIGEQLGISPKSVATLLARALRKLERAAKSMAAGADPGTRKDAHVPKTLQ